MPTVDELIISVDAKTEAASVGLSSFSKELEKLRGVVDQSQGSLTQLDRILSKISRVKTPDLSGLSRLSKALDEFRNVSEQSQALQGLSDSLAGFRVSKSSAANAERLSQSLMELAESTHGLSEKDVLLLQSLSQVLEGFQSPGKGSTQAIRMLSELIQELPQGLAQLKPEAIQQLRELAFAFREFQSANGKQVNASMKGLFQLPELFEKLGKVNVGKYAKQLRQMTESIAPLAKELGSVSSGFGTMKQAFDLEKAVGLVGTQRREVTSSGGGFFRKFLGFPAVINVSQILFALNRVSRAIGHFLHLSNEYVEDLNLFRVAMGDAASEAEDFAQKTQDILGIDAGQFMRNQGVFQSILTGFGIANDAAADMSKQLTQVSYDLSSLFNLDVQDAMQKVQSGISGELEPLRRLGFALDQATLQQLANNEGLNVTVKNLNQAQKSQLRYAAIMEQSANAQHDFARTLNSPANALRVLQMQFTLLGRSVGNLFIPLLIQVIPVVTAIVNAIRGAVNWLAELFGFSLPKFDYSVSEAGKGLSQLGAGAGAVNDVGGALDRGAKSAGKAKKAMEEYKNTVLGFDELNILNEPNADRAASPGGNVGGAGVGGVGGLGGGLLPLDMHKWDYDFLKGANVMVSEWKEKIQELFDFVRDHAPVFLGIISGVVSGIAAFKIGLKLVQFYKRLKQLGSLASIFTTMNGAVGLAALAIGALVGIAVWVWADRVKRGLDDVNSRFGNIHLTVEEARAVAEQLMRTPFVVQVETYMNLKKEETRLANDIKATIQKLNTENFKITAGIEVDVRGFMNLNKSLVKNTSELLFNAFGQSSATGKMFGVSDSPLHKMWEDSLLKNAKAFDTDVKGPMQELNTAFQKYIDGQCSQVDVQAAAKKVYAVVQKFQEELRRLSFEDDLGGIFTEAKADLLKLDFDSFGKVMEEASNKSKTVLRDIGKAYEQEIAGLRSSLRKNPSMGLEFIATRNKVEATMLDRTAKEVVLPVLSRGLGTIREAYKDELSKLGKLPPMRDYLKELGTLKKGELFQGARISMMISDQTGEIAGAYRSSFSKMSGNAQEGLRQALKKIQPQEEDLRNNALEFFKFGKAIPENVRLGLEDAYELEALTGSTAGLQYQLGKQMTESPGALQVLNQANLAGQNFTNEYRAGFAANLGPVTYDMEKGVLKLGDKISFALDKNSGLLLDNLKTLGVDVQRLLTDQFGLLEVEGQKGVYQFAAGTSAEVQKKARDLEGVFSLLGIKIADSTLDPIRNADASNALVGKVAGALSSAQAFLNSHALRFSIHTQVESEMNFDFHGSTYYRSPVYTGNRPVGNVPTNRRRGRTVGTLNAEGGLPDKGQLFVARESGPELVGMIGNKNAVVNNRQIVDSVSRGVFQAMREAMGGKREGDLHVYVGSREKGYREVRKEKLETAKRQGAVII